MHCQARGITRPAIEVDHVIALCNGGADDDSNLQGLCHDCHTAKTANDLGYKAKGNDLNGLPTDANHHWNK